MNDTQWRRYQVFLQERDGEPHQDAGSVHAPDAELALLNARDVFVRRPACVSLWVVPVDEIYSRTAEEIKEQGNRGIGDHGGVSSGEAEVLSHSQSGVEVVLEMYDVFCKMKPAGTQRMVGQVEAGTPAEAMEKANKQFSSGGTTAAEGRLAASTPFVWWVVPDRAVMRSSPLEAQSMFSPALDKPFRLSTDFRTLTTMREIKKVDLPHSDADQPEPGASNSLPDAR
jgi:ring-1,2-phenylacetyl-CoA epoxidase subunit PaaB